MPGGAPPPLTPRALALALARLRRPPPRRRRKLYSAFSELLRYGVRPESPHAIFARWLEYTQGRISKREIQAAWSAWRRLRTLAICLSVFAGAQGEDAYRVYKTVYSLRQQAAILDAWKHRFVMPRLESQWARRRNQWLKARAKRIASENALRNQLKLYRENVTARLQLEERLLFRWSTAEAQAAGSGTAPPQLAYLPPMLQLRRHEVLRVLRRSEALANTASDAERESAAGDDAAPSQKVAFAQPTCARLGRWLFRALTGELVHLPARKYRAHNDILKYSELPQSERYWRRVYALLDRARQLATAPPPRPAPRPRSPMLDTSNAAFELKTPRETPMQSAAPSRRQSVRSVRTLHDIAASGGSPGGSNYSSRRQSMAPSRRGSTYTPSSPLSRQNTGQLLERQNSGGLPLVERQPSGGSSRPGSRPASGARRPGSGRVGSGGPRRPSPPM